MDIPVFKKKVNEFLVSEEGKIAKKTVLAVATALVGGAKVAMGGAIIGPNPTSECPNGPGSGEDGDPNSCYHHRNSATKSYADNTFMMEHRHHYNHSSHSSHGSHGSHGSGGGMSDRILKRDVERIANPFKQFGRTPFGRDANMNRVADRRLLVGALIEAVKKNQSEINRLRN
jgi:hypothetical protein